MLLNKDVCVYCNVVKCVCSRNCKVYCTRVLQYQKPRNMAYIDRESFNLKPPFLALSTQNSVVFKYSVLCMPDQNPNGWTGRHLLWYNWFKKLQNAFMNSITIMNTLSVCNASFLSFSLCWTSCWTNSRIVGVLYPSLTFPAILFHNNFSPSG